MKTSKPKRVKFKRYTSEQLVAHAKAHKKAIYEELINGQLWRPAKLARNLGISRVTLYALIREIVAEKLGS